MVQLRKLTTSPELKTRLEQKEQQKEALKVDPDTLSEVLFGKVFGWEAFISARYSDFGISESEMSEILKANDKIHKQNLLELSDVIFNATFAARCEKPVDVYKQLSKKLRDEAA